MASQEEELAMSAAYEDDTPTPFGWKRKLVPRIGKGLIPARTDVIFITPDGEEFNSKTQLQRYLKANKGSPDLAEFNWVTDETPRRSTRSMLPVQVIKAGVPPKAAIKRKLPAEAPLGKLEPGKRNKTLQSAVQELKVMKWKRTEKVRRVTPTEGKSARQASVKRKRSVKSIRRNPARTMSVKTNGGAQVSDINDVEKMEQPISGESNKKDAAEVTPHDSKEEMNGGDMVGPGIREPDSNQLKEESHADKAKKALAEDTPQDLGDVEEHAVEANA